MKNRLFAAFKWAVRLLGALVVVWVVYLFLFGNFHRVDGDLYRSGQLFSFNLPVYIRTYGIRSIINLRGPSEQAGWYRDEKRIARDLGVRHVDFGISDRRVLSRERMDELVRLMQSLPKPLLIHCKAGADRTSLAAALYLYAIKCDPEAGRMISLAYGHFPWLGSRTRAMDVSFERYLDSRPVEALCSETR